MSQIKTSGRQSAIDEKEAVHHDDEANVSATNKLGTFLFTAASDSSKLW